MKTKILKSTLAGLVILVSGWANATLITNASFETGDFTGWHTQDLSSPFYALEVDGAGVNPWGSFFTSAPTDGSVAVLHGFDGNGPGMIKVGQDITVTSLSTITFNYRAAWLTTFNANLERNFFVSIEESGGGVVLETFNILTAPINSTMNDTGDLFGSVGLSAYENQTVRMNFVWDIPEHFTGPAFFQLDNVRSIPEPTTIAILALGIIGLASRSSRAAKARTYRKT
ncbi:PEP-CTERM sorting domain-containing protein [Colwellia psychrerythraea]|uniref:PEP motif putative anchor domain protein n=1 Tax=Colwellia psychrerythraea TaxID=28229 RepID=A0A099K6S1_COLPS|nr:PEP-CTERM sorting domain-containing protein [Colwellia psychrerythraea]KGJ86489.1 PEP motif putative anchor domain protein [Colwellia psychrerythraea]